MTMFRKAFSRAQSVSQMQSQYFEAMPPHCKAEVAAAWQGGWMAEFQMPPVGAIESYR